MARWQVYAADAAGRVRPQVEQIHAEDRRTAEQMARRAYGAAFRRIEAVVALEAQAKRRPTAP